MAFIDPYVTNTQNGAALDAALHDLPPPGKGATEGAATVLQLYVPAEHTTLDFGAGITPGIRMITDTHAHMTTLDPLSVISLGSVGGNLPSGGTPGINLYTNNNKKETILGDTDESYSGNTHIFHGSTKEEIVGGLWTETGRNAKSETIAGTVTQNFNAEHNLTVGKPAVYDYKGPKTETIGTGGSGDHIVSVNGNRKEDIKKDLEITVGGNATITHLGQVTNLWTGKKSDVSVDNHRSVTTGQKIDAYTGVQYSVNIGAQAATNLSIAVSLNETMNYAQNAASYTATLYSFSRTLVENSSHGFTSVNALINIFK